MDFFVDLTEVKENLIKTWFLVGYGEEKKKKKKKRKEKEHKKIRLCLVTIFIFYFQKLVFENIKKKQFFYIFEIKNMFG